MFPLSSALHANLSSRVADWTVCNDWARRPVYCAIGTTEQAGAMMRRLTWALCLTVFTASAVFATPRQVILSSAASTFVGYVAGPETSSECVVLVHDWFGVSTAYTEAVDRLARQGYCVVAVDLYNGRTATT